MVGNLGALPEISTQWNEPEIRIGQGVLRCSGAVQTGEYLEYTGGQTARVYDRNWNLLRERRAESQDFVMHLIESGCDLLQVRDLLGHVSIQTTNVYLRASLARKHAALETLHSDAVSEGAQTAAPQWRKPEVFVILDRTIGQSLCCES